MGFNSGFKGLIAENNLVEVYRISRFSLIFERKVLGWSLLRVGHSSGEMIAPLSYILLQDRKKSNFDLYISFESFYVRLSP